MAKLDDKCTLEQFNLLEIMPAGRAVTEVMKILQPIGEATMYAKGTVIIAALEEDVHDLGKNILKMILIGKGYRVVIILSSHVLAEMAMIEYNIKNKT
ncbi:MAG TPA: hypothetical protein VLX29_10340 [Nitrospirota bacterium]|nr:hypothetical protein [Nitrospirota bacterium]